MSFTTDIRDVTDWGEWPGFDELQWHIQQACSIRRLNVAIAEAQ